MTLSDLQGHLLIANRFKCDFSYSCAVDKTSTGVARSLCLSDGEINWFVISRPTQWASMETQGSVSLKRLRQWTTLIMDTWQRPLTNDSWPSVDITQVLVAVPHSGLSIWHSGIVGRRCFEAWNPIGIMRPLTGGRVADWALSVCPRVRLSVPTPNL